MNARQRRVPRRIVARTHAEAFAARAEHFSDPAAMTARDRATTEFKLSNVVDVLPITQDSSVLDIGPGDGTLFRMLEGRVRKCVGVDPAEHAVARLTELLAGRPDVSFVVGGLPDLPPIPGEPFDIVVANSVVMYLADEDELSRALASMARCCAIGGTCYVGEVHVRSEHESGLGGQARRVLGDYGVRRAVGALRDVYVRPLRRGDPLLLERIGQTLVIDPARFLEISASVGFSGTCRAHREPRRESRTRVDYLLARTR